jgi:phosphatidylglycerophosphatase C
MRLPLAPPAHAVVDRILSAPPAQTVVFDADGTLWRGDVGEDFLRFLGTEGKLPRHPEPGVYERYERIVARDPTEGYAFAVAVMADLDDAQLAAQGRDFFQRRYAGRTFTFVRPLLSALAAAGHLVWVCSASPRWLVSAGAETLGIPSSRVIAVDCELEHGRLTARVLRPLPCGEGKVECLKAKGLAPALGVGNGDLDLPMLAYAQSALVVAPLGEPGNGLVRAAAERGWPVQWS